jgi:hypothetical protein
MGKHTLSPASYHNSFLAFETHEIVRPSQYDRSLDGNNPKFTVASWRLFRYLTGALLEPTSNATTYAKSTLHNDYVKDVACKTDPTNPAARR